ncbi:MAG: DUF928 domain-containing protein [Candidatus Marinimicrobia bacterium]|nr:DUF928 domain-containing protein [Candidatus Neomarinimicrobiota bacterium]MCF7851158.1 DUF928 domain-containing protein [Candidatus Neomarinimicrobiota bacterium]
MNRKYLALVILISISLFPFSCESPEEDDTTPPAAPANLSFDANQSGDGEIYLTWDAPADDDVASYHIYRAVGTGSFTELTSLTATSYLDQSLDYTVEYSYKVTAKDDSENESPFSNTVSLTPVNLYSPDTPSGLEIKAHNIPSAFTLNVELSWLANIEGDFSHYKVYRSETAVFAPDEATELDSLTEVYYYDEDVVAGTTYYYKLIAYDLGGKASDPTNVVSDTPLPVPTLISPINAAVASSTTPTFHWSHVDKAVKYKIIVRTSQLTGDIWESTITTPTNATSGSEISVTYPSSATTLTSNTQYYWFISAYSQDTEEINTYTAVNVFRTP